jgi:hypothetical protein
VPPLPVRAADSGGSDGEEDGGSLYFSAAASRAPSAALSAYASARSLRQACCRLPDVSALRRVECSAAALPASPPGSLGAGSRPTPADCGPPAVIDCHPYQCCFLS